MISIDAKGINETIAQFEKLSKETDGVLKQSVYMGAGVVADTMKQRVQSLKTTQKQAKVNGKTPPRYLYDYEKQALVDNLGIAPIKAKESVNTKVGFDGYYTNKSGKQRPVPLLANSCNAGTSFMKKQAFINATKRSSQASCVEAMQKQLDKNIKKITK